jgi:hypothetical protein
MALSQMARTNRGIWHGSPREQCLLPEGTLVVVVPERTRRHGSPVLFLAYPVEGHPWPAETRAWAEAGGVPVKMLDLDFVRMPALRY